MSRTTPFKVYKSESHELSELPRGSYIQEYDGFYNWAPRQGMFLLCAGGCTEVRDPSQLDYPVTVHFVPEARS